MVRHEAAEALGAIGDLAAIDILREYKSSSCVEVAETCELALQRLECVQKQTLDVASSSAYDSIGAYASCFYFCTVDMQIPRRQPPQRVSQSSARHSSTRHGPCGSGTRRCLLFVTSTVTSRSRRLIKVCKSLFSIDCVAYCRFVLRK